MSDQFDNTATPEGNARRRRAMLWLVFVVVAAFGAFVEYSRLTDKAPGTEGASPDAQPKPVSNIAAASGAVAATAVSAEEAQFGTSGGITTDGVNLYAADSRGNRIRKIVITTGAEITLAGSGAQGAADGAGPAATFNYPTGVAASGGALYVADTANNRIRRVVIATGEASTLAGSGKKGSADGIGAAASFNGPSGIATDGSALYLSDTNNRVVRKIVIATGEVSTLAGSGALGATDGVASAASFESPRGIAFNDGFLYLADGEAGKNARIRKISVATGAVTTVAGPEAGAPFGASIGIATDGTTLYLVDGRDNRILAIALATGASTTVARGVDEKSVRNGTRVTSSGIATDGQHLYIADDRSTEIDKLMIETGELSSLKGTAAAPAFDGPAAIASDGRHLYVADSGSHMIRKIDMATGGVSSLAGWGRGRKDGKGTAALFNYPAGIASDGGNLYVADANNHAIRKVVLATGEVTTLAGSGSAGAQDGAGAAASFNSPAGIAVEGGNLYVADSDNHLIRKIVLGTGEVTTLAGSGAKGFHDGTGKAALFNAPRAIVADRGNLYVADAYNHAVRKIVIRTGEVTTLAGTGSQGAADAAGKAASFRMPGGIAVDGDNLYLADTNNHSIRKIAIATGNVTTFGGSGWAGASDGKGKAAAFSYPLGLVAVGGNLYVADSQNHRIRKIATSSAEVTTVAGVGNQAGASTSGQPQTAVAAPQPDVDVVPQEDGAGR